MNLYRMEDVAKHDGINGAKVWMAIQKSVYDFTEYINEHPGGEDLVLEYAGKDGTKAFNDFGHSSDAKSYMKKFKIGELVEDDKKSNERKQYNHQFSKTTIKSKRCILTKWWMCS